MIDPNGAPDELVVETGQLGLVLDRLGERAVEQDHDDQLGLTLVTLLDTGAVAGRLASRRAELKLSEPERALLPLDQLLYDLRAIFAYDYAGWTPRLGKNRIVTSIQFLPYPNAAVPATTGLAAPRPAPKLGAAKVHSDTVDPRGAGVRVGLLDTRLYQHRALAGRYIAAPPELLPGPPPRSGRSFVEAHSAFVGSLILAEAPAAELDARAVVRRQNTGGPDWSRSLWDVARDVVRSASSGVQILNCSWACFTEDGRPPFVLERALERVPPEVLVVAAAGNHGQRLTAKSAEEGEAESAHYRMKNYLPGSSAPAYPAALPNVVAVGALDDEGPAGFNPTAAGAGGAAGLAPWIDLLAPGVEVRGAYFGDTEAEEIQVPKAPDSAPASTDEPAYRPEIFEGSAYWSGTSFAAATVTGAIAARMGPRGPGGSGKTAREALDELLDEGDDRIRRTRPPRP
jgi:membrane-anchored mycosin MYCP